MQQTETSPSIFSKIFYYPITRIVLGLVAILLAVVLWQVGASWLLKLLGASHAFKMGTIYLGVAAVSLLIYVIVYRYYEKRKIEELKISAFPGYLLLGAIIGIGLQALAIFVMYLLGGYTIVSINPVSYILPGLVIAISSGVSEEILFRGVIFRIINEKWGSIIALSVSAILFGVLHLGNKNSSLYSAVAIAVEAGILLGACYLYSGNLWMPIGVHFGWNFAEADLFGGVLSGNVISKTLITAKFTGSEYLTGGAFGPENSVPSILICTGAGIVFLWLAYRKRGV